MNNPVMRMLISDNIASSRWSFGWESGRGTTELLVDGLEAVSSLLEVGIHPLL